MNFFSKIKIFVSYYNFFLVYLKTWNRLLNIKITTF